MAYLDWIPMLPRRAILRAVYSLFSLGLLAVAACGAEASNGAGQGGVGGVAGSSSDAGLDSGPACSGDWEVFSPHYMDTASVGDDAIFFRYNLSLHRLPFDGSGDHVIATLAEQYPLGAVGKSHVYLGGDHALHRISKSGGDVQVVDDSWYVNADPAVGGAFVYYWHLTQYDGVRQLRWIPDDGGQYQQVPGDYVSTSLHLVADETGAYFTSTLGLRAFHPSSGQRELLANIPGPAVVSLAVGSTAVFISTDVVGSATQPTLLRVSKDGSSSSLLIEQAGGVVSTSTELSSLRVQGEYVYFVQDYLPDDLLRTRIIRVAVQGGEPELMGELDPEPGSKWTDLQLHSDSEHLYVLRRDGVRRRCLPP